MAVFIFNMFKEEVNMGQAAHLEMVRTNQFERVYGRRKDKRITQSEAAGDLQMSERTFRRYIARYKDKSKDGLLDGRMNKSSPLRAGEEEVSEVVCEYPDGSMGVFHEGKRRLGVYDREGKLVRGAEEKSRAERR